MVTGFFFGIVFGVVGTRLWKPLLTWYLHKEQEVKNTLEKK